MQLEFCSFYEGDLLMEIQQVDDQWIWAKLDRTGQSGLVAVNLTLPLVNFRLLLIFTLRKIENYLFY